MGDEIALFDMPAEAYIVPPAPEVLSRGERRKRLVEKRIQQGLHPLGYVRLHPEASKDREGGGPRCGGCQFRVTLRYHDRTYPKCRLPVTTPSGATTFPRDTGCESSDIRGWWPACVDYQEVVSA